jgi:hypothetical protein
MFGFNERVIQCTHRDKIWSTGRLTGYPDIGLQKRFCPSRPRLGSRLSSQPCAVQRMTL